VEERRTVRELGGGGEEEERRRSCMGVVEETRRRFRGGEEEEEEVQRCFSGGQKESCSLLLSGFISNILTIKEKVNPPMQTLHSAIDIKIVLMIAFFGHIGTDRDLLNTTRRMREPG